MTIIKQNNTNKGIGFWGLLQIAFIVLKLCDVIKWRWLVVLIPTWISIGFVFIALLIMLGVFLWDERKS